MHRSLNVLKSTALLKSTTPAASTTQIRTKYSERRKGLNLIKLCAQILEYVGPAEVTDGSWKGDLKQAYHSILLTELVRGLFNFATLFCDLNFSL